MKFRVLGPIEVAEGEDVLALGGAKPRTILALLLLDAGRSVPAERLIDELWGEEPPPTAAKTLQVHVSQLRRVLGARLRTHGRGYAIDVDPGDLDADRFQATADAGRQLLGTDPARASSEISAALALWRGPAFADVAHVGSIVAASARLEEARLGVLEDRLRADLTLGRHEELVSELTGLVAAHPTRERMVGALMLALHRCDRDAQALAVYGRLCDALDEELGVDPGDELLALHKAIRRGDPALRAPVTGSVPAPATPLVGRSRELAEALERLSSTRLLTLVGAGGSGKTRLAVELAHTVIATHPDGAHFVDLSTVVPMGSVTRQVAKALEIREARGRPLRERVVAELRHRRCLLILDNCEHVIDDVLTLAAMVLATAPGVRILATSRAPLGLSGEVVSLIQGLDVASPDATPEEAAACDAVRLLVRRAAAAVPGFQLRPRDAPLAASVCRRLDGLPLAIELAAPRLRTLSVPELHGRLDRRLALLSGRATVGRHRTLRVAIDWSYELLDIAERSALRRLSVAAAGVDLAAAERIVADGAGDPPHTGDAAFDILTALVDRSMLVAERAAGGATRYRLLETIREYAAERLGSTADEEHQARLRHAVHYLELAEAIGPFGGDGHAEALGRLDEEVDNVRTALAWLLGDGWNPEAALRMAAPLWWFWWWRGLMGEGRTWLARVLAAAGPEPSTPRMAALRSAAALARNAGDHDEARRLGEEALAVARDVGGPAELAAVLNNLCITANAQGQLEASIAFAEESRVQAVQATNPRAIAAAINNAATSLRCLGRLDDGERGFLEALACFRALKDRRGEAAVLYNLAVVARRRGRLDEARALCLESLALYEELDLAEGALDAIEALGCVAADERRYAEALTLLLVAQRERERLGSVVFTPDEVSGRDAALAAARSALSDADTAAIGDQVHASGVGAMTAVLLSSRASLSSSPV